VAAYAGLMTDAYPPFRLDSGGHEPGGALAVQAPVLPQPSDQPSGEGRGEPRRLESAGWAGPRVTAVVAGAPLLLLSLGILGTGGAGAWAATQRQDGYVNLGTNSYSTSGYAVASDRIDIGTTAGWHAVRSLIGTIRLSATAHEPVFLGIAPTGAASRYLAGVARLTVTGRVARQGGPFRSYAGGAPPTPSAQAGIWTAQARGPGRRPSRGGCARAPGRWWR
jgi:hypothetical protein